MHQNTLSGFGRDLKSTDFRPTTGMKKACHVPLRVSAGPTGLGSREVSVQASRTITRIVCHFSEPKRRSFVALAVEAGTPSRRCRSSARKPPMRKQRLPAESPDVFCGLRPSRRGSSPDCKAPTLVTSKGPTRRNACKAPSSVLSPPDLKSWTTCERKAVPTPTMLEQKKGAPCACKAKTTPPARIAKTTDCIHSLGWARDPNLASHHLTSPSRTCPGAAASEACGTGRRLLRDVAGTSSAS